MKNIYTLWSGGLDSTYLIQKLLDEKNKVTAAYVEIMNNENKTKMEKSAIDKMIPILKEKYDSKFEYIGTVYKCDVVKIGNIPSLKQMPVWLTTIISTTDTDKIDKIAIGYVMNDCAISYLNDFKSIIKTYNKISHNKIPDIIFPLTKMNKDEILSKINQKLKSNVVSCENPIIMNDKFIPCYNCSSCDRNPLLTSKVSEEIENKKQEFVETFNKSTIQLEMNLN